MLSIKSVLLLAVVVCVHASPTAESFVTTTTSVLSPRVTNVTDVTLLPASGRLKVWTRPVPPPGAIDISDKPDLINKQKKEHGIAVTPDETTSPALSNALPFLAKRGGPCSQGDCPDFNKQFDMLFTEMFFDAPYPQMPLYIAEMFMRVYDCDQCQRKKVGTYWGGCYNFTSCGRAQEICVDEGNRRAHRIWKDVNYKKCYRMYYVHLGDCGFITKRGIWYPESEVACNW